MNCNAEIAISYSEKKFSKNSSLATRNVVSYWGFDGYSVNLPYITRHPTRHQNSCNLLIMWILYTLFDLPPLVTHF